MTLGKRPVAVKVFRVSSSASLAERHCVSYVESYLCVFSWRVMAALVLSYCKSDGCGTRTTCSNTIRFAVTEKQSADSSSWVLTTCHLFTKVRLWATVATVLHFLKCLTAWVRGGSGPDWRFLTCTRSSLPDTARCLQRSSPTSRYLK